MRPPSDTSTRPLSTPTRGSSRSSNYAATLATLLPEARLGARALCGQACAWFGALRPGAVVCVVPADRDLGRDGAFDRRGTRNGGARDDRIDAGTDRHL